MHKISEFVNRGGAKNLGIKSDVNGNFEDATPFSELSSLGVTR